MKPKSSDPAECAAPQSRVPRTPARDARFVARWVVFEKGRCAHLLREDDLFPAERTLCGTPALDADWRRLPLLNSQPADYQMCRGCLLASQGAATSQAGQVTARPPARAWWSWEEGIERILWSTRDACVEPALSVYRELFMHAEWTRSSSFPASIRRVAERAQLAVPVARKAVASLIAVGVLKVTRQTFGGRHLGTPNVYTLLGPRDDLNPPLNGNHRSA